ncbi:ninjurin-2 isoform X2 [Spea bombifrons]|uniref:ninjurin-2 isoform X2 n=1 Tax=Spea bombifrons TaxID=233779 RepID=UPI00234AA294|nr:ninjurin-2 isoform X2 [Spea bombifrons]
MCERFHMRTMRILCAAPLAPCSVDGVPLGLDEWYMCVSSCTPTQKTAPRQDPDTRPAQQPGMGTQGERISMEAIGNPGPARRSAININHYATKKSLAESMLDVALFMANATQLKAVLEQARRNLNDIEKQPRLDLLNNVATGLVFLTVLLNIFITAFGVQKTGLYPSRGPREVN